MISVSCQGLGAERFVSGGKIISQLARAGIREGVFEIEQSIKFLPAAKGIGLYRGNATAWDSSPGSRRLFAEPRRYPGGWP